MSKRKPSHRSSDGAGPNDLVKLYYRIGEVARIVGVQPHVLRYWETEFRSIRPQKSRKGQRIYSRRDVEKLLRVKDLLKNQGFTIAGAKRRLQKGSSEDAPQTSQNVSSGASSAPAQPLPARKTSDPMGGAGGDVGQARPGPAATSAPPSRPLAAKALRKALVALRHDLVELQRLLESPTQTAEEQGASQPPSSGQYTESRSTHAEDRLVTVARKQQEDGRPDALERAARLEPGGGGGQPKT